MVISPAFRSVIVFAFFAAANCSGLALAQAPNKPLISKDEALDMALEMADAAYQMSPTNKSRSELILSYERVIDTSCFANLIKTLKYEGPPSGGSPANEKCTQTIDKLLQLDSDNPVATCARDGIDSPTCLRAFSKQEVAVFSPPGGKDDEDSDIALEMKEQETLVSARVNELRNQLRAIASTPRNAPTPAPGTSPPNELAINKELLSLQCGVAKIKMWDPSSKTLPHFREFPRVIATTSPTPKSNEQALIESYIKQIEQKDQDKTKNATPTPSSQKLVRVRLLSEDCRTTIDSVLKKFPSAAAPICYREGWNSPLCIQSLRMEQKKDPVKPPSTSMEEF